MAPTFGDNNKKEIPSDGNAISFTGCMVLYTNILDNIQIQHIYLMKLQEKKSGKHQSEFDSSCGEHERQLNFIAIHYETFH